MCESSAEGHVVYCHPDELHQVAKALEARFGEPRAAHIFWRPKNTVPVDEEAGQRLLRMIDASRRFRRRAERLRQFRDRRRGARAPQRLRLITGRVNGGDNGPSCTRARDHPFQRAAAPVACGARLAARRGARDRRPQYHLGGASPSCCATRAFPSTGRRARSSSGMPSAPPMPASGSSAAPPANISTRTNAAPTRAGSGRSPKPIASTIGSSPGCPTRRTMPTTSSRRSRLPATRTTSPSRSCCRTACITASPSPRARRTASPIRTLPCLRSIFPTLAALQEVLALKRVMREVMRMYVGDEPHLRILSGDVRRGEVLRIRAAILFADMRDFTELDLASVRRGRHRAGQRVLRLHRAADRRAGRRSAEIHGRRDSGDLPRRRERRHRGLHARLRRGPRRLCSRSRAATSKQRRRARFDVGIALHFGNAAYGNVGSGARLDYTVIGRDVNLASRIADLCGRLGESLLLSDVLPTPAVGA